MTDSIPRGVPPVTIPDWEPPWPVDSTGGYVRITTSMLRGRGCVEQRARKARPDSFPSGDQPREPSGPASFPLGGVLDAAVLLLTSGDRIAADAGADVADRVRAAVRAIAEESWSPWEPESFPAVEAGVAGYLEVLESLQAAGELPLGAVVKDLVAETIRTPGAHPAALERVELWAWAIHHLSADGRSREVHLLRWDDAASVTLSDAEVAALAEIAAAGVIADHDRWYKRFVPRPEAEQPPVPERITVRVIGVLDGSSDVRFDGSPDEARAQFSTEVPAALEFLAGGSFRPSHACASCPVRYVCPGIRALPGLLGVAGFSPHTRSLSPSMLWTQGACPRQLHLSRDLGLPRQRREASPALERGTQVHAWLHRAHERGRACTDADLADGVIAAELGWSEEQCEAYLPYVRQHLEHCPLAQPEVDDLRSEVDITVWDTDANVVFSTRPDTAYLAADGRWVLRETKTLSPRGLPANPTDLLARYPQVAAAVCLLADGYRPDAQPSDGPGRVELELLGVDDDALITYDAADPVIVLIARTELAGRVDAWLHDTVHPIGEHPPCSSCEVTRWCTDRPEDVSVPGAGATMPALAVDIDWEATAPDHVLREAAGAALDDDEEFPF